jgi:hypothetical protein
MKKKKNTVSSSLTTRICLPYGFIGWKKADAMEDANVDVKTIVTCPFSIPFPFPLSLGKEVLTLGFPALPCDCASGIWVHYSGLWHA